jgi:Gluconate 2-dehydrogenase subunit 3
VAGHAFFSEHDYGVIEAACERLIPAAHGHPGATVLGATDYIDGLLGAFAVDPPRIWAGGPFSGRYGGKASFEDFLRLSRLEELAWRTRIEGSGGIAEREFNGPVTGWQQQYRDGIAALDRAFAELSADEQDARLDSVPEFKQLLYGHACEGAYGAPEYGGNRGLAGWRSIEFPGDVQPRGYTDEEVSGRE